MTSGKCRARTCARLSTTESVRLLSAFRKIDSQSTCSSGSSNAPTREWVSRPWINSCICLALDSMNTRYSCVSASNWDSHRSRMSSTSVTMRRKGACKSCEAACAKLCNSLFETSSLSKRDLRSVISRTIPQKNVLLVVLTSERERSRGNLVPSFLRPSIS